MNKKNEERNRNPYLRWGTRGSGSLGRRRAARAAKKLLFGGLSDSELAEVGGVLRVEKPKHQTTFKSDVDKSRSEFIKKKWHVRRDLYEEVQREYTPKEIKSMWIQSLRDTTKWLSKEGFCERLVERLRRAAAMRVRKEKRKKYFFAHLHSSRSESTTVTVPTREGYGFLEERSFCCSRGKIELSALTFEPAACCGAKKIKKTMSNPVPPEVPRVVEASGSGSLEVRPPTTGIFARSREALLGQGERGHVSPVTWSHYEPLTAVTSNSTEWVSIVIAGQEVRIPRGLADRFKDQFKAFRRGGEIFVRCKGCLKEYKLLHHASVVRHIGEGC